MQVNILTFGQIADITGTNSITLSDVKDTTELIDRLKLSYPELDQVKFVIAVDKNVVKENTTLINNNTVALLPPFSGG